MQAVEKSKEKLQQVKDANMNVSMEEIKEKASNTQSVQTLERLRKDVASLFGSTDEQ